MKKKIIGILSAIIVLLGGGYTVSNLGSYGNNDSVVKITSATSSIPVVKRSIYHSYGTSTDITASVWWAASSTNEYIGTPWTLVPENTGRLGLELYGAVGRTWFWIIPKYSTTTAMTAASSTTGWILEQGKTWNMKDYGAIFAGEVYALATTSTSTVRYTELK